MIQTPNMEDTDNSWVFDSLVCFLNGPVWNAPIQSFIEEKSLIFEANTSTNPNENPDYLKIYEEYKNLVDIMLGSYMEDIGITPTQFEEACNKGQLEFVPKHFDNTLFEQIWAANDFDMFKRMMAQRNVELQLQALELLEQKYGVMPESFIPQKNNPQRHITGETEAEIVLKGNEQMEEEIMEEVIKNFPYDKEEGQGKVDEQVQYILEERHILQEALRNIEETSKSQESPESSKHIEHAESSTDQTAANKPTRSEFTLDKKSSEIDQNELKKRQEYLRAQRDKLVALKKEARKKHLDVEQSSQSKLKNRPKSARVAKAVLTGDSPTIPHQQLKIRKTLAERLRQEVVGNTEV